MEALPFDKPLSPCKQTNNNPKRKTLGNISRQATAGDQNFAQPTAAAAAATAVQMERMMHGHHGGVFLNPRIPFSLSSSLPPYYTHLKYSPPPFPPPQKQRQPPLLPLPTAFLSLPAPPSRRHSLSPPYTEKAVTKKKPTNPNPKQHITSATKTGRSPPVTPSFQNGVVVKSLTKPVGPDPGNLPKDVTRVLPGLSASVFSLSPPPSSLPLPRFSLRQPKLSCTVEAATGEIDSGSTDNLSGMLKLR